MVWYIYPQHQVSAVAASDSTPAISQSFGTDMSVSVFANCDKRAPIREAEEMAFAEEEDEEEESCDMGFSLFDGGAGTGAECDDESVESDETESEDFEPLARFASKKSVKVKSKPKLDADSVMKSELGKISYGFDKITVNSAETNILYNYELTSRPCVIGLSINQNLEFVKFDIDRNMTELTETAQNLVNDIVNKKYDEFLKGKVYESTDCAICLEPDVNCVLYTCAHKCGHHDCVKTLSKCPICRAFIRAKLKTSKSDYDSVSQEPVSAQASV